jgi:NAD(P) transhydrogenase
VDTTSYDYDLLVIGSGAAGQKAAVQGAKLGKRVAIVERQEQIGGAWLHTGTIPSKALREAALYLSGYREHHFYGENYAIKDTIPFSDLRARAEQVVAHEMDVARLQLRRNGVELITADARFASPHALQLVAGGDLTERVVTAEFIVVATGTVPAPPSGIRIDQRRVVDSDGILALERLPRTLIVVGAGVVGCEYAALFATVGTRVTLVDARPRLLPFLDGEIVEALAYQLRARGVTLRLGETVESLETAEDDRVWLRTGSDKRITAEVALCSAGREGATGSLNLAAAGLVVDEHGRLTVDEHYRTAVPSIYAVGDVIGAPALASTAMAQGRLAVRHALGAQSAARPECVPYGIYTIPEIAMVGQTEEQLTAARMSYEVGRAPYRELGRGHIIGDTTGMLKLLFHRQTRKLLGVHIIGEGASEVVHVGQAVLHFGGTVDYFVDAVFNEPTLTEAYRTAALDGLNRVAA